MKKIALFLATALVLGLGLTQSSTTYVDFGEIESLGDYLSVTVIEEAGSPDLLFLMAEDEYGFNTVSFLLDEAESRAFHKLIGDAIEHSWGVEAAE